MSKNESNIFSLCLIGTEYGHPVRRFGQLRNREYKILNGVCPDYDPPGEPDEDLGDHLMAKGSITIV